MTVTKNSDYYMPCVAIWPDGRQRTGNVAHVNLDTVESARAKLAAGKVAWVRREDAERVRESVPIYG